MKPILLTILASLALALGANSALAQNLEALPPSETTYNTTQKVDPAQPNPGKRLPPAAVSGKEGIYSDSPWGIATTRRNDPAFVGLMEGLQAASKKATQKEINVPPASKEAIDDQISDLTSHNAKSIIIDAPRAEDVARIVANSKFLQINTVVITESVPEDGFKGAPLIVLSPAEYAPAAANAALEILKDESKGRIVFLASGPWEEQLTAQFTDAFKGKEQYEVIHATENNNVDPSELPTVVAALTASDTSRLASYLTNLPTATVIGTGETAGVKYIFDSGALKYRLHADTGKIFSECQRLIGNPVGEPVHLKPVADKSNKAPGPPPPPQ